MKFISYTDRKDKDCKMWTRVSNMYGDNPEIEILGRKEGEFVLHGCWGTKSSTPRKRQTGRF